MNSNDQIDLQKNSRQGVDHSGEEEEAAEKNQLIQQMTRTNLIQILQVSSKSSVYHLLNSGLKFALHFKKKLKKKTNVFMCKLVNKAQVYS